jgi:hypothetical protein
VRLDLSPIPKGKPTAYSNRAYFSPDATVSMSEHIVFTSSESLRRSQTQGLYGAENCLNAGTFSFLIRTLEFRPLW